MKITRPPDSGRNPTEVEPSSWTDRSQEERRRSDALTGRSGRNRGQVVCEDRQVPFAAVGLTRKSSGLGAFERI
ncbi:hypothetical protein, partial [Microlunatus parietis]